MNFHIKKIYIFMIFMILCLSGCQKNEPLPQKTEPEKNEVVIWTWDETFNVKAAKLAAEEYTKQNRQIEIIVETKEREEILSSIKNSLSAKAYDKLPDIIMLEDYDVQGMLLLYEE